MPEAALVSPDAFLVAEILGQANALVKSVARKVVPSAEDGTSGPVYAYAQKADVMVLAIAVEAAPLERRGPASTSSP